MIYDPVTLSSLIYQGQLGIIKREKIRDKAFNVAPFIYNCNNFLSSFLSKKKHLRNK